MKDENKHISVSEEEERNAKRILWRMIGMICFAIAFAFLAFYKTTDNNFYAYPAFVAAVLGVILVEKNKKESRIVYSKEEIEANREILKKDAILVKVHATALAEKKTANWIIAIWTLFVAGLVVYARYMNGTDYIARNWPGPAILLVFPWIIYIIWILIVHFKAKNDAIALMSNEITVLEIPINSVQHVGRYHNIPMVSFKSELYGKHEQLFYRGSLAQKGDFYYLVLRKNNEKYKLIDAYSMDKWNLDDELQKYLVKEVI